jgi:hypothetical protein
MGSLSRLLLAIIITRKPETGVRDIQLTYRPERRSLSLAVLPRVTDDANANANLNLNLNLKERKIKSASSVSVFP